MDSAAVERLLQAREHMFTQFEEFLARQAHNNHGENQAIQDMDDESDSEGQEEYQESPIMDHLIEQHGEE